MSRAFCQLISSLVESALPVNLGAGMRAPGFQPYLSFLRDAVFLRFPTRAYRRPAEKVPTRKKEFFILSIMSKGAISWNRMAWPKQRTQLICLARVFNHSFLSNR